MHRCRQRRTHQARAHAGRRAAGAAALPAAGQFERLHSLHHRSSCSSSHAAQSLSRAPGLRLHLGSSCRRRRLLPRRVGLPLGDCQCFAKTEEPCWAMLAPSCSSLTELLGLAGRALQAGGGDLLESAALAWSSATPNGSSLQAAAAAPPPPPGNAARALDRLAHWGRQQHSACSTCPGGHAGPAGVFGRGAATRRRCGCCAG